MKSLTRSASLKRAYAEGRHGRSGNFKHGMAGTPEHRHYVMARSRCKTEPHYIKLGIKFLFESFQQFYDELGATSKEQSANQVSHGPKSGTWKKTAETKAKHSASLKRAYAAGRRTYRGKRIPGVLPGVQLNPEKENQPK
jgi:hypothetical protein